MFTGEFYATFLIVFRESLEAALVVGIILTVLRRLKQGRYIRWVILSTILAIVASVLAGAGLMSLAESARGNMEKLIEGVMSLAACAVLTWMIFWMEKQARTIKPQIESEVEHVVGRGDRIAMMALPFFAVFREGAETVLFLGAIAMREGGGLSLSAGLLGFVLAVGLVVVMMALGRKVPLRLLFRSSGLILLLVAAGLAAYGIHELQEINVIPTLIYPVWNINHILNEKEGIGALLKALFGYNGNPSLIEVLLYIGYLAAMSRLIRSWRKAPQ